ncbi:hypothetical protein IFM89_032678 [Coptis chinensis]|uniref:F-box domain-containing protein n=1 Tax=Coptis chinensis TaxID=261450 RepID=A0A835IJK4_9MAGN|nr:hypothetical protein IFM89_032678 [Coptis chinensis]
MDTESQPAITDLELRNWLELPRDVISLILIKLGAIGILCNAQSVCSTWRSLSKQPHLFRSIDMRSHRDFPDDGDYEKMRKSAKEAVDRSRGELVEFSMARFGNDDLLHYIVDKSSMIKCLRLVSCYISNEALIEVLKKTHCLEEIELCYSTFSKEVIEEVGKNCCELKSFRLNCQGYRYPRLESDEEAFAIAENMPQLRSLHLFGNKLTNVGLEAILDKCPYLEYLDLRECFGLDLNGDLEKKCVERIKSVRLPDDSTEDYEYEEYQYIDDSMDGYGSYDDFLSEAYSEDYDGMANFSEGDLFDNNDDDDDLAIDEWAYSFSFY